jgi:glycosyltransferase involved in cell wall biosynthesis
VAPQVDGIIALDDGSSDGSAELLAQHEALIELLRRPGDRPTWDEVGNHRLLIAAALRHAAEWILCIDADERLERQFRARAERAIARGRLLGFSAFAVRLRELWDQPHQYRTDGIWGRKMVARLFRARQDHEYDPAPLHGIKAPLQARCFGRFPGADLTIYHLGMLRPEDREARRRRSERADPEEARVTKAGDYRSFAAGAATRSSARTARFVATFADTLEHMGDYAPEQVRRVVRAPSPDVTPYDHGLYAAIRPDRSGLGSSP